MVNNYAVAVTSGRRRSRGHLRSCGMADALWLLFGGLGVVGLALATWHEEHGLVQTAREAYENRPTPTRRILFRAAYFWFQKIGQWPVLGFGLVCFGMGVWSFVDALI
jgi:hypothetical protein